MIGWKCCAASHGWLFMSVLKGKELCLLNPVTRARIDLPPRPHNYPLWDAALSSDPATATTATGDRAVVVVNYLVSTFICRVGDKHWTKLCESRAGTNFAFHKGLPHMTGDGDGDSLVAYDLTRYLIEGGQEGADLLQVLAGRGDCYVLKLVGGKDGSSQRWVRMKNLGGGALFVSRGHSELVSADVCATMGMKGDCVYELDRLSVLWEMSMKYGSKPAAIPYLRQAPAYNTFCSSLWFSPSIPSPLNRRKRVEKTESSLSFKKKKKRGGRNNKGGRHFNGKHSHHTDSVEMRSNKVQKVGADA